MPETELHIEGLEELLEALDRFPLEVNSAMVGGMHQATQTIRTELATYPPRRIGVKATFASDKQRKGFFYKLRHGEIEVPYRRGVSPGSERLGASWTTEVKTVGSGQIKGIVGSRTSYGPLVQGEDQTEMHKTTGWKTVEQVLLAKKQEIEQALGLVVAKVLERISRG